MGGALVLIALGVPMVMAIGPQNTLAVVVIIFLLLLAAMG